MDIQHKVNLINTWLRYHPDYEVRIDLCTLYGCIGISIYKGKECLASWIGAHLDKRLDEVIAYLKIEEWKPS